jgi:hypothetical protein
MVVLRFLCFRSLSAAPGGNKQGARQGQKRAKLAAAFGGRAQPAASVLALTLFLAFLQ